MGEQFMTQHFYIRDLFAKHGLMPNEHFMNGLTMVCSITGCGAEDVLSDNQEDMPVYSRHLWFWYMRAKGFSPAAIAAVTGKGRSGIYKGIEGLDDKMYLPYVRADKNELFSSIRTER